MEDRELISIIMPVFNTDKYLQEAIDSVLNQTYANFELIIVDDNSTDNSFKIAKSYENKKVRCIHLEKNMGAANARNVGLNFSKGDIICFIDSDDVWEKDKLKKQYEYMKTNRVGFCYCKYRKLYENGSVKELNFIFKEKMSYEDLLRNTEIGTSTVMFDTNVIPKELIKMKHFETCEDTATWFRITKEGYEAYIISEYLVNHRVRKGSLSYNKFRNAINMYKIYRIQEKMSIFKSIKFFTIYGLNAINKRIK